MVYNMLMIPEILTVCIIIWHREDHKGMEGGRGWNINLLAQRLDEERGGYLKYVSENIVTQLLIKYG